MSPKGFSSVEAAIRREAKASHKKQDYFVLCSQFVGEQEISGRENRQRPYRMIAIQWQIILPTVNYK